MRFGRQGAYRHAGRIKPWIQLLLGFHLGQRNCLTAGLQRQKITQRKDFALVDHVRVHAVILPGTALHRLLQLHYHAGVVAVLLAAVQRITTARWSRAVIRVTEGFVAFLPVAFVMLLLTVLVGKTHIFPWTHEAPAIPEKHLWLDPLFWSVRTLVTFGLITLLSLWFVWTSVRLDVGILPDWGSQWAKGIRARMRAGT